MTHLEDYRPGCIVKKQQSYRAPFRFGYAFATLRPIALSIT